MAHTVELFVVPHVHWDREWFEPQVRFRQRLVETLDAAIEALETSERAGPFLLDGQTVIVRDYLEVRPDQRSRVEALVRGGRLLVGPWYVLTDELLPADETLVRNLLLGRADGQALGGWLPVGYSPDAFGHPAALPTVLSGFGIRHAILWRGYGGSDSNPDLFRWRGPDGSLVLVHHLPPEGYEVGAKLPTDPHALRERWARLRAAFARRASQGPWLLLSGADHHRYQTTLPDAVDALVAIDPTVHAQLASPVHYFEAVPDDAAPPEVWGELRESYGYTWTLQGVHATRSRLKRRIAEGERLLLRWAEPAAALAALRGGPTRMPVLASAWRDHLENGFHDSLAGTTTDQVARDVGRRAAGVITQAHGILVDAIHDRLGIDRAAVRAKPADWEPVVAVMNPSPYARGGVCECTITVPREQLSVGFPPARRRGRSPGWPRAPGLMDEEGRLLPLQVLEQYRGYERLDSPDDYPVQWSVAAFRVACLAEGVPPLGLSQLRVVESRSSVEPTPHVWLSGRRLAAEWGSVAPDPGGGFALVDDESGRTFTGLGSLVSERDVGDAYTHQLDGSTPPLTAEFGPCRTVRGGPLVAAAARDFHVPGRAHGVVYARLDARSRLVRFVIEGWNHSGHHRLRVLFPLPQGSGGPEVLADMQYGPVQRRVAGHAAEHSPMEYPVATAPMHRYVSVAGGLTVFGRGTYEYELTPDGKVAVTLLRAVGELSRDDLAARPGHAAWPAAIPDAQELGPFRTEMAVAPRRIGSGTSHDDLLTVETLAEEFHAPLGGLMLNWAIDPPRRVVGPLLDGSGLVFKAAKPSESGSGVVLRCVNVTDRPVRGAWVFAQPIAAARLTALDESAVAPLVPIEGGRRVEFLASPRAVVTVQVEPLLNRPS
ncbi:MAG: hypothetical protein OEZ42_09505 [Gemmatimonadota bacterium]|nr:hypothetical protein [Gemmatimonadota bacterium]